jgi:hypothetical protein
VAVAAFPAIACIAACATTKSGGCPYNITRIAGASAASTESTLAATRDSWARLKASTTTTTEITSITTLTAIVES